MKTLEFGSIELIEYWGSDEKIAKTARVTTGSSFSGRIRDLKLLARLYRDDHGSPLEFGGLIWRIKLPIFLARQLHRHRVASHQEYSGRYQEMEMDFFHPELWHEQPSEGNRQVGGEPLPEDLQREINADYHDLLLHVEEVYNRMINLGVAREEARISLPLATFTTVYVQFNVRSLMNFLRLRLASDAQRQWKPYVDLMAGDFAILFPLLGGRIFPLALKIDRLIRPILRHIWKSDLAEIEKELEKSDDYC